MLCRGNISSSKKNFKKFQPKSQVSQVTFPLNIAHLQLSTFQKSQTLAPVFVVAKMLPNRNWFYPQATVPFDSKSLQLQAEQKPRCFSLESLSLVCTYSQNWELTGKATLLGQKERKKISTANYFTWFIKVCLWLPGVHWLHCIDDMIQAQR